MELNEAKQILENKGYLLEEGVNFSPVFDAVYNMQEDDLTQVIKLMKKINEASDEEEALKYKDWLIDLFRLNYLAG